MSSVCSCQTENMETEKLSREFLSKMEMDIREGRIDDVVSKLETVPVEKIAREARLPLANFCRRVGLPLLGLKILAPVVGPARTSRPLNAELSEYALLLQRCGAVDEASRILESLNPKKYPDVLLNRAFIRFNEWDFAKAIELLRAYLEMPISSSARNFGRLNLARALVTSGQAAEALELLASLAGAPGLVASCHELRAQCHVALGDLAAAKADLPEAVKTGGRSFAVEKWQAVIDARESGSVEPLERFRNEAFALGDWENVRFADYQASFVAFDEGRYRQLLYGTPWRRFRAHAQKNLGRAIGETELVYGNPAGRKVDLVRGTVDGMAFMAPGEASHTVLMTLLRDFYKPTSIGQLFSVLMPGEDFDPSKSPALVQRALVRTRQLLMDFNLPIEIQAGPQGISLALGEGVCILIPFDRMPASAAIALKRAG